MCAYSDSKSNESSSEVLEVIASITDAIIAIIRACAPKASIGKNRVNSAEMTSVRSLAVYTSPE